METRGLVIFDIDHTMTESGSGTDPFYFAVSKVFGIEPAKDFKFETGKADVIYLMELSRASGIDQIEIEKRMQELYAALLDFWEINGKRLYRLAGVKEILEYLKGSGYALAVITGNIERTGRKKLELANVLGFFDMDICSFGDAFVTRGRLIEETIRKAERKYGIRIDKRKVLYFGDSALDVAAAKEAKVRICAVSTGKHTMEHLNGSSPDFLLKDLSDTAKVIGIVRTVCG
ncbi:MAG: HAD family hydrolase [Candidatus Micrarchaeota archaeon]|nr:HAD family hydrolase [Candidatus Micrarchaeota archaeon]MDE1823687.1 HAD family hydrolase [Candidatus Micrarchaeota archaeon]MDE1849792.1 HAD family hydrolase [Candidatus Micrarchaeota archaeon]